LTALEIIECTDFDVIQCLHARNARNTRTYVRTDINRKLSLPKSMYMDWTDNDY